MADGDPLVSVVMPTHNRLRYLPEAVESVLAQRDPRWELSIVDDGSTDGTAEYLRALERRDRRVSAVFHSRCANPAVLRNAGIARARGDYVAFLDSDDVWLPNKLTEQVGRLQRVPQCGWSYTGDMLINGQGEEIPVDPDCRWVQPSGWILPELISVGVSISMSSVLVEKKLLRDTGGFYATVLLAEDYDLWFRLASRSPVLFVPETLVKTRRHADNFPYKPEDMHRWWLHICQKVFTATDDPKVKSACQQQFAFRMAQLVHPATPGW